VSYPKGRTVFGCLAFERTDDVVSRIQKVAQDIFLDGYLEVEGAFLSHGQKQWLEIGMLLMQEPELIMLDEPVAGMSSSEREQTAELLKRICKGRSIIIIEHDMEFVSRIAHKVTVLHLGKILAEGTMQEVQNNPSVVDVYLGH
jgi:urea transport system ATP-binding protein